MWLWAFYHLPVTKGTFSNKYLPEKWFQNLPILFLKKRANSGLFLFIFVLFKHKFYRKNCRRQQDSNSDRWSRRRARWPLDHHHGPNLRILTIDNVRSWFAILAGGVTGIFISSIRPERPVGPDYRLPEEEEGNAVWRHRDVRHRLAGHFKRPPLQMKLMSDQSLPNIFCWPK